MAPRSAKAKKAATVETTKKGRGKTKIDEEIDPVNTIEANEEIVDKKSKRSKKVFSNNQEKANGESEEIESTIKQGKKKKGEDVPLEETSSKKIKKGDASELNEDDNDAVESNGSDDKTEPLPTGKGRKKTAKKENTEKAKDVEDKQKQSSKGRKTAKQTNGNTDNGDNVDFEELPQEKSKPAKGRGKKAQAKIEEEKGETGNQESEQNSEVVKESLDEELSNNKSMKKNQTKSSKEKVEPEEMDSDEKNQEDYEEKESKKSHHKKGGKGKKNKGKKETPKEDYVDKDDDHEEEPASKKAKKEKGDANEENDSEEEVSKPKPKGRRGAKKTVEAAVEKEEKEDHDSVEPSNKRQRKVAEEKVGDGKKKAPPKNKAVTNYEDVDFSNSSTNELGKIWNFKIACWNVDGIRAWMTKGGLDYIKYEKPDILCLQEVKCAQEKLPEEVLNVPGYHAYWLCSDQDGYAGVGILTTKMAIHVENGLQNEELDSEGRIITAEYEQFYLVCTYVPNAGRKLVTLPKRLKWNEEFRKYVRELDKKKPVIICGDMNVAHNEIDLTNPKSNKRNAGFTEEERTGMTELLSDGFVDTYRHLYPDKTGAYTFWTYMMNSRAKNVGWRLDYFIVSQRFVPALCDNVIRSEVYGSDHCPIALFLHLPSADKPQE